VNDSGGSSVRPLMALVTGLSVSSCGTGPDDLRRCSPPLAITVTQSPLTFAWGPSGCDVEGLTVIRGNTTDIVWHIGANPDENSIQSPVRYGVPPTHVDDSQADTLGVGPYTVQLTRFNPEGTALEISDQDFTYRLP
jgi:hypothetical protein